VGVSVCMPVRIAVRVAMRRHRAIVMVLVTVVPQFRLVEQKEEHQAEQQHCEQRGRRHAALESFRQQVHEGGGQQGTGRQAEQLLRPLRAAAAAPQPQAQQAGRDPDAADARDEGRADDGEQRTDHVASLAWGQAGAVTNMVGLSGMDGVAKGARSYLAGTLSREMSTTMRATRYSRGAIESSNTYSASAECAPKP